MDNASHLEPIPRPPGHLFVGNLFDLDASHPIESLMELARNYGPIFQIAAARPRVARHRVGLSSWSTSCATSRASTRCWGRA